MTDVRHAAAALRTDANRGALAIVLVAFALVLGMLVTVSTRWDAMLRETAVPLDNLAQSRIALGEALLLMAQPDGTDDALIDAKLGRALVFARALEQGRGGMGGLPGQRLPASARPPVADYLGALDHVAQLFREGRGKPGTQHSLTTDELHSMFARAEEAARRVEADLWTTLEAARARQLRLDLLNFLLVVLTGLVVLGLRYRSELRRSVALDVLSGSEARVRAFAAALPDVALLLDEDGRYLEVFGHAARVREGRERRATGTSIFDVFPREQAESYHEVIRRALSTGAEVRYEYTRELPDGPHWFEARVCPIIGAPRVAWVGWDVTDRRLAQQRLRKVSRLYSFLSQVNHAIVVETEAGALKQRVCDLAVRAGEFSAAWVSWLAPDGSLRPECACGLSAGRMEQLLVAAEHPLIHRLRLESGVQVLALDARHERDLATVLPELERNGDTLILLSLHRETRFAGMLGLLLPHGNLCEAEDRLLLREVGDDLSHALGHLAVAEDLRQHEARTRLHATALEGIRDGVLICDAQWRIQAVNQGFQRISAYREEDLLGQPLASLDAGRKDDAFLASLSAVLPAEGYWQGEVWCRRRGGAVYPQLTSINAVSSEDGATSYVVVATDLSELHELQTRLSDLSLRDPLTGLASRKLLEVRLEQALASAQREGCTVAVMFFGLDRFKQINDGLGYRAGDEVLLAVARRLSERYRREDTLSRYGGDEFVLILPQLPRGERAASQARDLLDLLEAPFSVDGREVFVKASVGISLFPEDGDDAAVLIGAADTAMHQAKQAGRGGFRYYTQAYTQLATVRLDLESRLRTALRENGLAVHYQPLISLEDGHLIGAEALVRLQDGREPRLGPAQFIPLLEETGLIVEFGAWVQREVCRQGRIWLNEGRRFEILAINLSATEVSRGDVGAALMEVLEETGYPPDHLEIEITESGLMQQGERAVDFLLGLRNLGMRLAIDDFGTGYSSLAYLKRFPVSKLKIDRSFIRDIPTDLNDMQLTTTIVSLARNLGLRVLAEGVETQEQFEFLKSLGCHAIQGYLVSPPLPAEEFAQRFLPRG